MVLAVATALALAGIAGVALGPLLSGRRGLHSIGLAFAAGTLLTTVLVHVMPEAMAHTSHAAVLFVCGFVGMMMLHQSGLEADPCCGHEHARRAGLPSFLAMCLCSANDGIVLSSDVDRGLASPMLWAIAVHQATAAFALLVLLRDVGLWRKRLTGIAYMAAFVAVAPIALLVAARLAVATEIWGIALALAAGALLYVVAGSLVPRVEHLAREQMTPVLLTFVIAVLVSAGVQLAAPHDTVEAAPAGTAPHVGR
jgi:zinc transporter ZupT